MSDTSPNAAMHEYWNGPVGERWAKKQADFDRNMSALTPPAGNIHRTRSTNLACTHLSS